MNKKIIDSLNLVYEDFIPEPKERSKKSSRIYVATGFLTSLAAIYFGYLTYNHYVDKETTTIHNATLEKMLDETDKKSIVPLFLEDHPDVVTTLVKKEEIFDYRSLDEALFEPSENRVTSILNNQGYDVEAVDEKITLEGKEIWVPEYASDYFWYFPNTNILYDFSNDIAFERENDYLEVVDTDVVSLREIEGSIHLMHKSGIISKYNGKGNLKRHTKTMYPALNFFKTIYGTEYVAAMNNTGESFKIVDWKDNAKKDLITLGVSQLAKLLDDEDSKFKKKGRMIFHDNALYYSDDTEIYTSHGVVSRQYEGGDVIDVGFFRKYDKQFTLFSLQDSDDEQRIQIYHKGKLISEQETKEPVYFNKLQHTRWLDQSKFFERIGGMFDGR